MEAFIRAMHDAYEYVPCHLASKVVPFCASSTFRRVYYHFISRLEHDYTFQCVICKDAPDVIICDGTSETIAKAHYRGRPVTEVVIDQCVSRAHTRNERSALWMQGLQGEELRKARKVVTEFAAFLKDGEVLASGASNAAWEGDSQLFLEVGSLLGAYDFFFFVLSYVGYMGCDERGAVAHLLSCMGSESPVIAYLPVQSLEILQLAIETGWLCEGHVRTMETFSNWVVVVIQMMGRLSGAPSLMIHPVVYGLLLHLMKRAVLCISGNAIHDHCGNDDMPDPSCHSRVCLDSGVCSGLPQVRGRCRYELDGKDNHTECKHRFVEGSHGSHRTGGIFCFFCKHSVCYAFFILPTAEGRNEAFSFFTSYFVRAPRVIVYDFACQLHEFCLNREPVFFRGTRFVVDRFHLPNHKSCAKSYDIGCYNDLDELNTEVAEQANSSLRRIKATISQMAQEGFMFNVRLYLDDRNVRKNRELMLYCEAVRTY